MKQLDSVILGDNHICAYLQNGRRCSFPGTRTSVTLPTKFTKWFCSNHYEALDNPRLGGRIFEMMDLGEITLEKKNWRDELVNANIEKLRASNPELFFKPENQQERDEYQQMMMGYIRQRMKFVVKKLPYDKNKSISASTDESALIQQVKDKKAENDISI